MINEIQKHYVNESINAHIESGMDFRLSVLATLRLLIDTYDSYISLGLSRSASETMTEINYCKSKLNPPSTGEQK